MDFVVPPPSPVDVRNPRTADDFQRLGNLFEQRGELEKAISSYDAAIHLAPGNSLLYIQRARALVRQGDNKHADADCTKALSLDKKSVFAHIVRAEALSAQGEFRRAKDDLETALSIDKANVIASCNLAWILATCPEADLRDGKRAVELATSACEKLNWERPETLDTLAAATAETGDFEAATRVQKKALALPAEAQLKSTMNEHLLSYQARKPLRDPAAK
ncbi:MAG: hypothetical protein ABUL64_00605 [Singulisphaera sp.]